jgi:hypothetical protein
MSGQPTPTLSCRCSIELAHNLRDRQGARPQGADHDFRVANVVKTSSGRGPSQ